MRRDSSPKQKVKAKLPRQLDRCPCVRSRPDGGQFPKTTSGKKFSKFLEEPFFWSGEDSRPVDNRVPPTSFVVILAGDAYLDSTPSSPQQCEQGIQAKRHEDGIPWWRVQGTVRQWPKGQGQIEPVKRATIRTGCCMHLARTSRSQDFRCACERPSCNVGTSRQCIFRPAHEAARRIAGTI